MQVVVYEKIQNLDIVLIKTSRIDDQHLILFNSY